MKQNADKEALVVQDNEVFWPLLLEIRHWAYENIYIPIRRDTNSIRAATLAYYDYMGEKMEEIRGDVWDIPIDGSTPLETIHAYRGDSDDR